LRRDRWLDWYIQFGLVAGALVARHGEARPEPGRIVREGEERDKMSVCYESVSHGSVDSKTVDEW
jgi:N-acyl-D-aspartate/D-glutamate deacylase